MKSVIIKYERLGNNKDNYFNDLITECKILKGVMVGSAYCVAWCKNRNNHNEDKKEVDCKNEKCGTELEIK